jgi:hypothetical protein
MAHPLLKGPHRHPGGGHRGPELIDGGLPPTSVAAATSWCVRHRETLRADWQRVRRNLHPVGRYDQ